MSRILTLINLGRTKYNDCLNLQRHIQKEHMDIANACKDIFREVFPTTSQALGYDD